MSTISSGVGLVSGLPINDLVDSLISVQARPITLLQARIGALTGQRTGLLQISAQLSALRNAALSLKSTSLFSSTTATSSAAQSLAATVTGVAQPGTYSFSVRSLARAHQLLSTGFASPDSTAVGAGVLTIESAAGRVNQSTLLGHLNGGQGVQAGRIRITDRSGQTADVDLVTARTVDDVINAINAATGVNVTARVDGDRIVIEDATGGAGALVVADIGVGRTAADLGIAKTITDPMATLAGDDLVYLSEGTRIRQLNDGNGIRARRGLDDVEVSLSDGTVLRYSFSSELRQGTALAALNQGAGIPPGTIKITDRAGHSAEIDLSAATTVQQVVDTINNADGISVTASFSGSRFVLIDNSVAAGQTAVGNFIVEDVEGTAGDALGLLRSTAGTRIDGDDVYGVDTVADVLRVINLDLVNNGRLTASLSDDGQGIKLVDTTGGAGTFEVRAINGSRAADDLGILTENNPASGSVVQSRRLVAGLNTVFLRSLNGGNVALPPLGALEITDRSGQSASIDLSGARTLPAVISLINSQNTNVKASLSDSGLGLVLTDSTPAASANGNLVLAGDAALALKIATNDAVSSVSSGNYVQSFQSFNDLTITDRGGVAHAVDLSGAQTLADVIAAINALGGGNAPVLKASVSASGLGIEIEDLTGGAGNLVISGSTADVLNIRTNSAVSKVSSGNLQKQYVNEASPLASLFDGAGVPKGKFRITDSTGASAVVDLTQGDEKTLGDVISEINSRGIGVRARINDGGDGLIVEDIAGGTLQLKIAEEGGTVARALGILGTAKAGESFIDGSREARIGVVAGDSLDDVLAKIQAAGAAINASIINDGSSGNPYRLSISSTRTGLAGELALDGGTTGLQFQTLASARDAAITLGEGDSEQPLVVFSSGNSFTGVISGVRIDALATTSEPVTVTVNKNPDAIVTAVNEFVTRFNALVSTLDQLTSFTPETNQRGILQGDATARRVRASLTNLVNRAVPGISSGFATLSSIGVKFGNGGVLTVDETKLRDAIANDPASVTQLFTFEQKNEEGEVIRTGLAGIIEAEIDRLTNVDSGVLTLREEALQTTETRLNARIAQMQDLLEARRLRLLDQFNHLESVLANLQGQQTALAGLSGQINLFQQPQ